VIDPAAPSQIRIFGRSMYVFAIGWTLAAAWLWYSGVQQHLLRHYEPPPAYAVRTLAIVLSPMPAIALTGFLIRRWTGAAPTAALERREWVAGFWWALVPNWIMFTTVYVMIRDLR
jgi:hypothetical protein